MVSADYSQHIETLRQLAGGLLPQIRSQLQRLQTSRTPMEMSGHLNFLTAIMQQHTSMVLSTIMMLEESLGTNVPSFPHRSGDEAVGESPLPELSPSAPLPAAPIVSAEFSSPNPALDNVQKSLESRIALLNECREFCLWQIDEMNQDISQLNQQLEASRAANRRHMTEVIRLEQALKKVTPD